MAKKKEKAPKKSKGIWTLYDAKGGKVERKAKYCPKCGPGHFMAPHKDRSTCGSCKYTEFSAKK